MRIIYLRHNLERAVPVVKIFAEAATTALSFLSVSVSANVSLLFKFGCFSGCRDTCVCFPDLAARCAETGGRHTKHALGLHIDAPSFPQVRTDDRGTHAEKKGPLFYVNSAKVGEKRARLGEEGMGWYRKGKLQHNASIFHANLAAYPVPTFLRTHAQTELEFKVAGPL